MISLLRLRFSHTPGTYTRRRSLLAQSLLYLVARSLGSFRDVGLKRLSIWLDQLESFSITDAGQGLQQPSVNPRRIVLSFQVGVKKIRTLQLGKIANSLLVTTRVEFADNAKQRF